MKKLLFVLFIMMALGSLFAEILLTDDFTGDAGTLLTAAGWSAHSSAGSTPMSIAAPGLTYGNYVGSGIGNATSASANGEDINKGFTAVNSGSVYYAFMINTGITTTTAGYSAHFMQSSSIFFGRFWIRLVGSNVNFGLAKTTAAATWDPTNYATGTTYLIVLKYVFNTGSTTDDAVYMWVNPAIQGTEPAPNVSVTTDTANDATSISMVGIRQWNTGTLARFDGVRVATVWTDLFSLSSPVINAGANLDSFTTLITDPLTPSDTQQYIVSGTDLTSDIHIVAPAGFQLSLSGTRVWADSVDVVQSGGTASETVYVRFNPALPGTYGPADIVHTSTGAPTVNKSVSGIAYAGTIDVTQSLIPFTGAIVGTPTGAQTYQVTGSGLTSSYLEIRVTGPFEIMDPNAFTPTWEDTLQVLPNFSGDIDVRYSALYAGTQTGHIYHSVPDGEAAEVVVDLSGTATLPYVVTAAPTTLNFGTIVAGTSSSVLAYHLSGENLDVNIAINAPANFEISLTGTGDWTDTLNVATSFSDSIYVRFNPTGVATSNANVTNVSSSAYANVNVLGTATLPSMPMNIQVGTTLTRNFDIIGGSATATLLTDWRAFKSSTAGALGTWATGVTATERNGGNNMSTTAGNGIYNFGAGDAATAADRAIGFLSSSSSTKSGCLMTKVTNTGSSAVTSFNISYTAEKYRKGSNVNGFSIKFFYSSDGINWTDAGDTFKASWGADADNSGYDSTPGDTQTKTGAIVAAVPQDSSFYFCWQYGVSSTTTTSNAQALGVDDISILPINTPLCQTPTFNPESGVFSGPTYVELSCATAGSTIYYTTNDTTPTTGSTEYTEAIYVDATTTIKAVAIASGFDLSPVASGTFTIPIEKANIAALRTGYATGTPYKITGEVVLTLKSATRNAKYIQDATGAILIDDQSGVLTYPYVLGDGITGIIGTLATYGGMLQLTPLFDAGDNTSAGNEIIPEVITLSQLNDTYQAKLVTVNGVTFPGATGVFATDFATNYQIQDATGFAWCRDAYLDLDYVGTAIPLTPKNITGVVLQYNTSYQLVPRSLADIADGAAPDAPIEVVVSVSGNDIHLDWADDATVSSWTIWASDVSPTEGYGTEPAAIVTTNTCVLTGDASTYGQRFYYVKANR